MPHFGGFGIEVVRVFRVAPDNQRHALDDINARLGKNVHLARVIGQQTHFIDAQKLEHIRTQREVAFIGRKPS